MKILKPMSCSYDLEISQNGSNIAHRTVTVAQMFLAAILMKI